MSTGFAFKQSLHLCSVSNLRIFLVFQLRTFRVGFSGPKTFCGLLRNGPQLSKCRFPILFVKEFNWLCHNSFHSQGVPLLGICQREICEITILRKRVNCPVSSHLRLFSVRVLDV